MIFAGHNAGSICIGASAALIISVSTSFGRKEPEPLAQPQEQVDDYENANHIMNWSETHECRPKRFYQPETHEELETLVSEAHVRGKRMQNSSHLHGLWNMMSMVERSLRDMTTWLAHLPGFQI